MSKNAFDQISAGLADAIAIAKGEAAPGSHRVHIPADVDVLRIRRKMGLTRDAFAMRFGLQLEAVRDWEQRKCRPEGAARVLLQVIEKEPEAVIRALATNTPDAWTSPQPGAVLGAGRK
jgi:putative transcriptional regulator